METQLLTRFRVEILAATVQIHSGVVFFPPQPYVQPDQRAAGAASSWFGPKCEKQLWHDLKGTKPSGNAALGGAELQWGTAACRSGLKVWKKIRSAFQSLSRPLHLTAATLK